MPCPANQVDTGKPFTDGELLYRRAFLSELNSKGELVPTQLESFSFSKDVDGAPSVLRSAYSVPEDAVHRDCAGKKDVSMCVVFEMAVADLPGPFEAGDGKKKYAFWPVHKPLVDCGAHSVIGSHLYEDTEKVYAKPSSAVVISLRVGICAVLKPCDLIPVPVFPSS